MAYDMLAAPKPEDEKVEAEHDAPCKLTDEDFLRYVADERGRSVGFQNDGEVQDQRTRSLNYFKGDVSADLPAPAGRSAAVSMDVADAIETILPDLIDIFVSEDVAAFEALNQAEEKQVQTETDYVHHVLFDQNAGFLILYTMFKDALTVKTGMVTWWWEAIPEDDKESVQPEAREVSPMEAAALAQEAMATGQPMPALEQVAGANGLPVFKVTFPATEQAPAGKLCIEAFAPDDFTIAADATTIDKAAYCARRARPRIQELVALGLDAEAVRDLPAYSSTRNDSEERARDTAGEGKHDRGGAGIDDLRQVEVVYHYLRVDADEDGQPELWEILTGADETTLLSKSRIGSVPVAAVTPYLNPHRFYGNSVADHMAEIMRIKTTLTRGYLDSIYFALNPRHEINTSAGHAGEFTLSDAMNNTPGWPVRSKSGNALRAIGGTGTTTDFPSALEYFSTVGEQRTGVVRMAQGLNPDTLHDTAKGAMAMLSQAQRRIRLIARIFGETGLKDLFVGIHAMLRENAQRPVEEVKLRSGWKQNLTPSTWPERSSLKVKIGLGAAGRDHDLAFMERLIGLQTTVVEMQGGTKGPFVTDQNVSNTLHKFATLGGQDAELYFTEPQPADPNAPPAEAPPDPEMAKVQAKLQIEEQAMQGRLALKKQEQDAEMALAREKAAAQLEQARIEGVAKLALKQDQIDEELAMAERQIQDEQRIKLLGMALQTETDGKASDEVEPGGEPG